MTGALAGPTAWWGPAAVRSARFRSTLAHLALDPVVALLALGALAVVAVLGVRPAWARAWTRGCVALERGRVERLLGRSIPPPSPRGCWRDGVAYGLAVLALGVLALAALTTAISVPATLVLLPAYRWGLPGGTAYLGAVRVGSEPSALGVAAVAAVFALVVSPSIVRGAAGVDRAVATRLLGPGRAADPALEQRVEELVASRARLVDSVEAERRRIERDLHDGAQQRLVALALVLGRAQARLGTGEGDGRAVDPAVLAPLLLQAHEEADAAIAELRDLTRGLSPPVLTEQGIVAALSLLAARSPLPVELDAGPGGRLPAPVEAVLYFVAAEALTNVSKHAGASRADVVLQRHRDRVRLTVTDDGRGGASADPDDARAGGLVGLADRLSGLDGTLRLRSPHGGPTVLTAEVPCE